MIKKIVISIVFLLLICGTVIADNWNVTWTPVSESIIEKEYIITVQNLQDVKKDVNISSFFAETNFDISKIENVDFYEWKLIPYIYTVDHYDEMDYLEYDSINDTWFNRSERVLNYTETIESEKLGWKKCKSKLFKETGITKEDNYGFINIPKHGSKDTGDGTYDGTKIFKLKFRTPIIYINNNYSLVGKLPSYGSSGKVAILLDNIEYHPYWNTSWSNRKIIILTGNTSGAQTDYQILLNVTYETGMQTDFDDLRFTNQTHELDLWLESKVDNSYALVWVEFPTTPANGIDQTYYMYYGNDEVSNNWDIETTFLFGDDFPGASLNTDKWAGDTDFTSVSGNVLTIDGNTNIKSIHSKTYNHSASGVIIEFKGKPGTTTGWTRGVGSQKFTDSANAHKGLGGIVYYIAGEEYIKLWDYTGNAHTEDLSFSNVWTEQQVKLKPTEISITISGVTSSIANTLESHPVGIYYYNDWQIQNFRVRKYVANPPTYAFGIDVYYAGSIHYNTTNPYNHTIESDGTITANHSIIATDDINWTTAAVSDDCQIIITEYNLTNTTIAKFTLYNASLNWVMVTNLTIGKTYNLTNSTTYEYHVADASSEANFTSDLIPGNYQILLMIIDYTPPDPTNLDHTTGNFWVNHTWAAGFGNVTDSYNVSVNDVWHNTSPACYNDTYSAHAWQNITVYAFNSSNGDTLSFGYVNQNTQVPNNPVTITNTSDWSGNTGDVVYVDYDGIDADSDTLTFSCNRIDLFTDFSTSTGKGNWTATANIYYVDFGVSDGYGSISNYTMTLTELSVKITLLDELKLIMSEITTGFKSVKMGNYLVYAFILIGILLIIFIIQILSKCVYRG